MANPQRYQPLSHALHPPLVASSSPQLSYTAFSENARAGQPSNGHRDDDEDSEEDEEDVVEGALEDQDKEKEPEPASVPGPSTAPTSAQPDGPETTESYAKRRPGRPRGSKNKKPRISASPPKGTTASSSHFTFALEPTAPPSNIAPTQLEVPSKEYYDFRWRVLNLCGEFYGAADELVRGTSPHVLAQCFDLASTQGHALTILNEAKRTCDLLLATPQAQSGGQSGSTSSKKKANSSSAPPAQVITSAQTFSMPLGPVPPVPVGYGPPTAYRPSAPYAAYGHPPNPYAPPGYPTTPYYHYAPAAAPTLPSYYTPPPPPQQQQVITHTPIPPHPSSNQGAWSEEETEKLKKLAEESRQLHGPNNGGEIDWDWVTNNYGNSRTRHQILIKATNLGLKESSTRNNLKRRRETDSGPGADDVTAPAAPQAPSNMSPTMAHTQASTTTSSSSSPVIQHSKPPSSSAMAASSQPQLQWPMPTVAATTPSPLLPLQSTTTTTNSQPAYYRDRPAPNGTSAKNG